MGPYIFLVGTEKYLKRHLLLITLTSKKSKPFAPRRERKNFIIDENDIPSGLTAESFKQIEKDREDYFNCFAINFLDMSNDEKIKVLEEIAKRPRKNDK